MDPERFDAFAQSLARLGSRRRFLGVAIAGAVAPLTASAKRHHGGKPKCLATGKRCMPPAATATQPASATSGKGGHRPTGKDGGKNRPPSGGAANAQPPGGSAGARKGKGKHRAPSCAKCCSGLSGSGADGKTACTCVADGDVCQTTEQCCAGTCRIGFCTGCPSPQVTCGGLCVDLETDPQHCGSCDKACDPNQRCQNGGCVCDAQSCSNGCCDGTTCKRGTSDLACGDGGAACRPCGTCTACDGATCVAKVGACCGAASACQNGQCVDCASGQRCQDGACICDGTSCPSGCCDGATCQAGTSNQACGVNGLACVPCSSPQVCHAQACCTPNCAGKCGGADDGCGGACNGACGNGQRCCTGTCAECCNDGDCKEDGVCTQGSCGCPGDAHDCPLACVPLCSATPQFYQSRFASCLQNDLCGPSCTTQQQRCAYCTAWMNCFGDLDTGTVCGTVTGDCP